jgi:hypothetical protein
MATELVELGRVRISIGNGREEGDLYRKMGDENLYRRMGYPDDVYRRMGQIPVVQPQADMDQVYSVEELKAGFNFRNASEAFDSYRLALLLMAIRSKVAFVSDLWAQVKVKPELVSALEASEDGKAWFDLFTRAEPTLLSLAQPNYATNMGRIISILEADILLTQYGIGVKGYRPMYLAGQTELSASFTDTTSDQRMVSVYDFGDLSKTKLSDDLDEVNSITKRLGVSSQLGNPFLIGVAIVFGFAILALGAYGIYGAIKIFGPREIPPEVQALLKQLEKVDPQGAAHLLQEWLNAQNIFGGVISVLKWTGIVVAVLLAGGLTIYAVS